MSPTARRRPKALLALLAVGAVGVGGAGALYWARATLWPGTLAGKVIFRGVAPAPTAPYVDPQGRQRLARDVVIADSGEVANALVWVEFDGEIASDGADLPTEPLDFLGDGFSRPVVALSTGQELEVQNRDTVLHNFHTLPGRNAVTNRALPGSASISLRFREPEKPIPARCDLHPIEQAVVAVFDHPYFAVTDSHGRFEIAGVPPGKYSVRVWHERLGDQSTPVRIVGGRTSRRELELPGADSSRTN